MPVRADLEAAWWSTRSWVGELLDDPDAASLLARPSVLDGWTVADLVAHLGLAVSAITAAVPAPRGVRPLTVGEYLATYPEGSDRIDERTRGLARSAVTPADLAAMLDERAAEAWAALDRLGADGRRVVQARRGPIRLTDLLRTRVLELVVHCDDLARSLPDRSAVVHGRRATRLAVVLLLDALGERAPGRSVEVRVPPFGAVQCLEGTKHTRGTPPGVVETDATTWLRLACGRQRWVDAEAAGVVLASGTRAGEVAEHLPLV